MEAVMGTGHGEIWWCELNTHDPAAARDFYSSVMGWTPIVTAMADMGRPPHPGEASYTVFMQASLPVCGVFDLNTLEGMESVPAHWMTYVAVKDVDASCQQISATAGAVVKPPFDVPGVGRIAIVRDPTGAVFGIGTPRMSDSDTAA
jgi:uncharacterized protein